jgi:hypothetical protein
MKYPGSRHCLSLSSSGDPNVRLAVNDAAGSKSAVGTWVVRRIARDKAFAELFHGVLARSSQPAASTPNGDVASVGNARSWEDINEGHRGGIIKDLGGSSVIRCPAQEAMPDYGNWLKVMAGLERAIAGLTSGNETGTEVPNAGAFLRWAVAAVVGIGTVTGGVVVIRYVRDTVSKIAAEIEKKRLKRYRKGRSTNLTFQPTECLATASCDLGRVCAQDCPTVVGQLPSQISSIQQQNARK